jgi:hypothetical protein
MILRANSRLHFVLGEYGSEFLEHAIGAFQRLLPHVEIDQWQPVRTFVGIASVYRCARTKAEREKVSARY